MSVQPGRFHPEHLELELKYRNVGHPASLVVHLRTSIPDIQEVSPKYIFPPERIRQIVGKKGGRRIVFIQHPSPFDGMV